MPRDPSRTANPGGPRQAPSTGLRPAPLRRALVRPDGLWSEVRVVAETGSTNADVAEAAQLGAPEGLVLIAESQVAGRGRLGRSWSAPPGTSITMSVLLRPRIAPVRLGWLPLLTGVAVVEACTALGGGVEASVKWPNDLLVRPAAARAAGDDAGWGKCGGILAEAAAPDAIVVGIGINVRQAASDLPVLADPTAYPPTSLILAGGSGNRQRLTIAVLRRLASWYERWRSAEGDAQASGLLTAYRTACRTLGRQVVVSLPGGRSLRGMATDVDADGRLVLRTADGEQRLAAGDVHHVRPPAADRSAGSDTGVSAEARLAPTH